MDFFDGLNLVGGLSLFLFGMNIMSQSLQRRAGERLRMWLAKLTTGRLTGLLTGLGITAIIQSSSATTVMVVGFVNSGIMTLLQAIHVIMGANIGTTITAWLLSLSGIDGSNFWLRLLKPESFTPVIALAGVILHLFCRQEKRKDTGLICLGFALLMFGMEMMSQSVSGLAEVPGFTRLLLLFQQPLLAVCAGAAVTAIIQSSSASVGILQALASTGQVRVGAAIPLIMGQNIGTCVTAMLAAIGANKNAQRAALVHLLFNVIGTSVWLSVFILLQATIHPAVFAQPVSLWQIAVIHSLFNLLCTALMLPLSDFLEKLVTKLIPDASAPQPASELDERLLLTPAAAVQRCETVAEQLAVLAGTGLRESLSSLRRYSPQLEHSIKEKEEQVDHIENQLRRYLVRLSNCSLSENEQAEAIRLLKNSGDFERISDLAVDLVHSAAEMYRQSYGFPTQDEQQLSVMIQAVRAIIQRTMDAFTHRQPAIAAQVEPLNQVIMELKEQLRDLHLRRLQQNDSEIAMEVIWEDILINLQRIAGHCTAIAGCLIELNPSDHDQPQSGIAERRKTEIFLRQLTLDRATYALKTDPGVSEA